MAPRRPRRPGTVHCIRPGVPAAEGEQSGAAKQQTATDEQPQRKPPGISAAEALHAALKPTEQSAEPEDDEVLHQPSSEITWSDDVASNEPAWDQAAAWNRQRPVWAAGSFEEEEVYRLAQKYGVATIAPGTMTTRVAHEQRPVLETTLPANSSWRDPSRKKRRRKRRAKNANAPSQGARVRRPTGAAAVPAATGRGPDLNHRISDTLEKAAAMTQDMKSLQWAIFLQLDSPGGPMSKTARRRQAETPNDRLADGILLPADAFMTLVESDVRTYAAAVKGMVHQTQDAAKKLRIDGLDKDLMRRVLQHELGESPTLAELHFVSMACNNIGCLLVRKGNIRESLHHFHDSLEYFQQQREQRRGGASRAALVKHLENGARRRLMGDGPPDEENRRRDEAIIRLNLCGALQSVRMYKAAFTQAQTSLTLLLHDHADNAVSGALLALAHFYVGHLKKEVLSADDWLAMQNRAACTQVLESLIQSVEVSRTWSSSNAVTRCFEAYAKQVLGRLDSCAMDEDVQLGYSDGVTPVKDSIVLRTSATLASGSASVALSPTRGTDIEKDDEADSTISPELHMMHLRTPSPSKWSREWKNVARLNRRDELALFNETLETCENPTPQTAESNGTTASFSYGANSTSSVFDELPDLAPRMLSEVSSEPNICSGKPRSVDAHCEYYQGRTAVRLAAASRKQHVNSKSREVRRNECTTDPAAKHSEGNSSSSSSSSSEPSRGTNDTAEQDLGTVCTPESALSTSMTDFMLTATPNHLRHGAGDLGPVSPSFRCLQGARTPTGTPASIFPSGTGLHEQVSTPSVLRDTLQTPSILRSGGAAGLFDSMRSVDFVTLNETATREKLSVQWPSSRGRADAVTIPHTRSDDFDDEI